MLELIDAVLEEPAASNATRLFERVCDWGLSDLDACTRFMTDVEWSFMSGSTPIEDG